MTNMASVLAGLDIAAGILDRLGHSPELEEIPRRGILEALGKVQDAAAELRQA